MPNTPAIVYSLANRRTGDVPRAFVGSTCQEPTTAVASNNKQITLVLHNLYMRLIPSGQNTRTPRRRSMMIGSAIDVHDRTGQLRTTAAEQSTRNVRDRIETVREQATIEVRRTDGIVPKGESKARTVSSVPVTPWSLFTVPVHGTIPASNMERHGRDTTPLTF
jgi:hypothetical protein